MGFFDFFSKDIFKVDSVILDNLMSIKWSSDFHKSHCDVVFRQKQNLSNYFSLSLEFSQQINVVFTIYRKGFFESENSSSPLPTWNRFLPCQIFDTWYKTFHNARLPKNVSFSNLTDIFTILQNACKNSMFEM